MKKGFTLIELLIVIGILAILATTVVLVLNPAQILSETRDTQRISDLDTLRTAMNLYLATVNAPDLDGWDKAAPDTAVCGTNWWSSHAVAGSVTKPFTNPAGAVASNVGTTTRASDGSGWVPVQFSLLSGGSPVPGLPIDPNPKTDAALDAATPGRFYAYQCDNTAKTYEFNANMESTKMGTAASGPEDDDGGNNAAIYEMGNDPGLNL